jgi:O-antigen ligase
LFHKLPSLRTRRKVYRSLFPAKLRSVAKRATVQKGAVKRQATEERPLPLGFASLLDFLAFGILCLLLVIAPFLLSGFWPVTYDWQPQVTFLGLTACAALLLALRPLIAGNEVLVSPQSRLANWLILAFLGWCALALTTAVYRHDAVLELARIAGCVAWFFLARALLGSENAGMTRARLQATLAAVALGALLVCGLALANFANTRDVRQFSTFYNPNLFANYTAMALPPGIAWTLQLWRSTRRNASSGVLPILAALIVCVIGAGLIVTSSKGGFLSALSGLAVFALCAWRARGPQIGVLLKAHRRAALAVAVLVMVGGGALSYKTVLPRLRAARTTDNNSTMFRAYTWRGTVKMIEARPLLGWGPGGFPVAYPHFAVTGATLSPHESWLQIAAENGVPALLLLLGACSAAAWRGGRSLRAENGHWLATAGALGALTAFALHGLTDSGWGITSITLLLFFTLALLNMECSSAEREEQRSTRASSNSTFAWLAAAILLAAFAWSTQRAMKAEATRDQSRKLLAQRAPLAALDAARQATQLDPSNARLWSHLAQVQEALGENPESAYRRAITLQPTRAANWLNLADWLAQENDASAGDAYNRAVALDPNGTVTRLARAQWRLAHGDARGWDDLEYIVRLRAEPYGRYPALDENTFINLDFTRAALKLAGRAVERGEKAKARSYLQRVGTDLKQARKIEKQQAEVRAALGPDYEGPPPPDLDALEGQLEVLREQLR